MLRPLTFPVNAEDKPFLSTNMNSRSLLRVVFGLTQHLMRDRSGIAFTEGNELEQISQRVSFAPTKIDVREPSGLIAQVHQEGSDCVRHCRAFGSQNTIAVNMLATDLQHTCKFRSVAWIDFEEDDWLARRNMIILALLLLLRAIFLGVAAITAVSDDSDRSFTCLVDDFLRLIIQDHALDAKLCRARDPRDERSENNRPDEERSDLDAFWPLDNVDDRRVTENESDDQIRPPLALPSK